MADYYNVTTNIGDAEIAAAIASNTKLDITHIAFGDENGAVPIPSKARTTLVREVHRQAVTKYERHATNANWIVIETIIPSNTGGFWVREMGVIANGKLISHGSHAPFEKVADPTGVSEYRLKFTQNITDGSVVEITLDESLIYASQAWVNENYIRRNEIVDNLTTDDAFKPVSAKQAKKLQEDKLDKTANAVSATKLETVRTVSFSGAATGSFKFDGSSNSSAILTLANSGVDASTYGSTLKVPVITVNEKGLISGVSEKYISSASTNNSGIIQLATNAEVLEGTHATRAITPLGLMNVFSNLKTEKGYQKLPGGLILQWGINTAITTNSTITFPIVFPNACINVQATNYSASGASTANLILRSKSTESFSMYHINTVHDTNYFWFAIGY